MIAVIVLSFMALSFGLLLGYSAKRFKVEGNPVVDQINDLLPQTQCGRCGFPGCRPYAEAVASEEADLNQCAPGGDGVIKALAQLLDRKPKPLNTEFGEEQAPTLAIIKEDSCIGCTLCIQACPVDAIVGAAKQMHTVIASECTGCELCVPPCPVDCIIMETIPERISTWCWPYPVNEGLER